MNFQMAGNDFYCSLCSFDCINSAGKLLHVLEDKHIEAYRSSLMVSCNYEKNLKEGHQKHENVDRWNLFSRRVYFDEVRQQPERTLDMEDRLAPASGGKNLPHHVAESKLNYGLCKITPTNTQSKCENVSTGENYSSLVFPNSLINHPSKKRKKSKHKKKKFNEKNLIDFSISKTEELGTHVPLIRFNEANVSCKLKVNSESCNEENFRRIIKNVTNSQHSSKDQSDICCSDHGTQPEECFQDSNSKKEHNSLLNVIDGEKVLHRITQLENESEDMKTCDSVNSSLKSWSLDTHKQEGNTFFVNSISKNIAYVIEAGQETPANDITRRVIVEGFPAEVDKKTIMNQFSGYGFIKSYLCFGSVIHIEYFDWHCVEKIMESQAEQKIKIQDQEVKVKKNLIKPIKEFRIERIPENVRSLFSSEDCFFKKINEFLAKFHLDTDEMCKQQAAFRSVISCLKSFGPRGHPFGSRVSGFASKHSDLDIFIDITKPLNLVETKREKSTQAIIIHKAAEKLRGCEEFKAVKEISNASVPIVRCTHLPSHLRCDLSFLDPYGVCNTRLILYYLSLDSRVRPLILLIRYWASTHCLSGKGKFSNYCLNILCIFYLQQMPNEPVLPSVSYLLNLKKRSVKSTVGCWDCDFCDDVSLFKKMVNKSSLFQLIKGFFKFYYKFDAENLVISPFLGKMIKKNCFESDMEECLPKEFGQYILNVLQKTIMPFDIKPLFCVQDPFVHNHNLGKQIGVAIFQHFQTCCGLYADNQDFVYKCYPYKT